MDYSAIINPIIEQWTTEFIMDLQDRAKDRLGNDTGAGPKSIDAAVLKASAQSSAQIIIAMNDHLRLYDMRNAKRDRNLAPQEVEDIKSWIERKGVSNFLSGYKYSTTKTKGGLTSPVSIKRIINNIAWGISKKKKKIKRKRWYNKYKGKQIYRLYSQLLDAVLNANMEDIKLSISAA